MVSGLHALRHFRASSVGFLRLFDGGLHWQAPAVELILSKKKFRGCGYRMTKSEYRNQGASAKATLASTAACLLAERRCLWYTGLRWSVQCPCGRPGVGEEEKKLVFTRRQPCFGRCQRSRSFLFLGVRLEMKSIWPS